jgi:hypothetical protein
MVTGGRHYLIGVIAFALSLLVFCMATPAQADEEWWWTWDSMDTKMGSYTSTMNGWVTFNVTNNTPFAWGDFNMEIQACCGAVDWVHFEEVTNSPSSSQSFTYNIDNVTVGATLDYFYYSDPIGVGESGWFKAFISNPASGAPGGTPGVLYTLAVTPSIVPEPISSILFVSGGATLGFRYFRKRRKAA